MIKKQMHGSKSSTISHTDGDTDKDKTKTIQPNTSMYHTKCQNCLFSDDNNIDASALFFTTFQIGQTVDVVVCVQLYREWSTQ